MKKITNEEKALETFKNYLKRNDILNKTKIALNNFIKETNINLSYLTRNCLKDDNNIFICKYKELSKIKKFLNTNKDFKTLQEEYSSLSSEKKKNPTGKFKAYEEIKIFFENLYNNFSDCKNPYEIMTDLNVRACPYCNLNYIDAVIKEDDRSGQKEKISNDNKVLREHFDHYLPKSKYPFFALSFYNLIPCCYECNSALKKNKMTPVHPFEDNFDELAVFEIEFAKEMEHYNFSNVKNININIINKHKKAYFHKNLFELETRYKYRKDYACELLAKKEIYNDDMIDEITRRLLGKNYSKDFIEAVIWGSCLNPDLINERPLSKLTKDIINGQNNPRLNYQRNL